MFVHENLSDRFKLTYMAKSSYPKSKKDEGSTSIMEFGSRPSRDMNSTTSYLFDTTNLSSIENLPAEKLNPGSTIEGRCKK